MDTRLTKPPRRRHRPEFKQQVVDACLQAGASVAGVALAHGLNANLVRRWLQERGELPPSRRLASAPVREPEALEFVPLRIDPVGVSSVDIRLDLRRGGTTVSIQWPVSAADACGAWLRDWLR